MSGTIAGSRLIVGHAEPPGVARHTRLPLPPGRWADVLRPDREFEGHARVADLFTPLPVALLERVTEP